MATSSSCNVSLPEELVVEILSWLPPESLVQFKCLGKYWYSLISALIKDPSFVAKHLQNLNHNIFSSPCIAFSSLHIYDSPIYNYKELFSLLTSKNDNVSPVVEGFDLPIIPGEKDMSCVTISHCNGVVCLADYYNDIILCNPALKKSRRLPKPSLVDRFVLQGVGFGHDSRANDYKVVRFGRDQSVYPRAELYSLESDSWKEIQIDPGTDYFPCLHIDLYFNGIFYWFMSGRDHVIRSFDMSDEVFRHVPLPKDLQAAKSQWTGLGVWNDSVALFFCPGEKGVVPVSIEVWTVNDCVDGVKGCCSWKKELTMGPFQGIDCPFGFLNSEEFLMRAANFKEFVSYNVRTQKLQNVKVNGLDGIGCRAFSYVKSLVSVQR